MRYYGNKSKILNFIDNVITQNIDTNVTSFCDIFSGTSAVGYYFKQKGFLINSNDNLEFAYSLAKTYIETNKKPQFTKLKKEIKDIFEYLNNLEPLEGFIYKNYSPYGNRMYFTEENALKIDAIRTEIEKLKNEDLIDELEYYYLITSLLKAINLVSNISGTYAAFLKTWDKRALKPLIMKEIEVFDNNKKNKVYKKDSNELIKNIKMDILYIDPPYNTRQYASNYFLLELIAEGWFDKEPEIYGKTGMRKYEHQKSKYCSRLTAYSALNDLVINANAKYIVLSYNDEGILTKEEILEILSKKGEPKVYEIEHKRYRSINQDENDRKKVKERLFFVKVEKKIKKRANNLNGKEWLKNSFSIWRDLNKNEEEKSLNHPAIFNIELCNKVIDCYVKENNNVLLDPFAGSGSFLISGLLKNMKVIGFDINEEYKKIFEDRLKYYNIETNDYEYIIDDARNLSKYIENNSIDFCFTSPPYWDILNQKRTADLKKNNNYSNKDIDVGNISRYEDFIRALKSIFQEVYKVLKIKAYFIVNVMDLRKKSNFYPLHIDIAKINQEIGFKFEDIIIWDRQKEYNNMKPLGYPYKFIINKVHEYLLVFRKE